MIKQVITGLTGLSVYEKKIVQLLKQSRGNAEKKAYKVIKRRLGSHKRAMKKRSELEDIAKGRK